MRKFIYNAVSLFSGAGGLDLGFHQTGEVRTLACFEWEEDFCATLELNRRKLSSEKISDEYPRIVMADLADPEVLSAVELLNEPIDIVYGGPPCQSFSIMGKKGATGDKRGALIYSFYEAIARLQPRAFLFENVPHFAAIADGSIARDFLRRLRALGYGLWSGNLNAANFGALTFRTRFFIVGIKGRSDVPAPEPTHRERGSTDLFDDELPLWRTCEEVFAEVEAAERSGRHLHNHDLVNHSAETVARFRRLAFGETDNVRKRNRLDPNRPSHSIYVGGRPGKLQARTHIHPYLPRELTPRECALIHGFPVDWAFQGRRDSVVLQVANSVPVPLARALATHIVREMKADSAEPHSTQDVGPVPSTEMLQLSP